MNLQTRDTVNNLHPFVEQLVAPQNIGLLIKTRLQFTTVVTLLPFLAAFISALMTLEFLASLYSVI